MSDDTLSPLFLDLPVTGRPWQVTVSFTRPPDEDQLVPPRGRDMAELAAAAVSAKGLMTAFRADRTVLVMTVEAASEAEALAAGTSVVRAIGHGRGASVAVMPIHDTAARPG